jgi:hypothetical protein
MDLPRSILLLLLLLCLSASPSQCATTDSCSWDDLDGAVERFASTIRFATVSNGTAPLHVSDAAPFEALDAFLQGAYPLVWERLEVEKVGLKSL